MAYFPYVIVPVDDTLLHLAIESKQIPPLRCGMTTKKQSLTKG